MNLNDVARLYEAGRLADAEIAGRALIARTPRDPSAHVLLAEILFAARREIAAADAITAALRIDPGHAPAHALRGTLALGAGNAAEAVEAFERALPTLGGHAQVVYRYALALHQLGRDGDAQTTLERAASLAPGWPAPRIDLGHLALRQDRHQDAERHYRIALAMPGAPPELLRQLGDGLRAAGRPSDAVAVYRQRLAAAPHDGLAWRGLAQALEVLAAPIGETVTAWGRAAQFQGGAFDHTRHGLSLITAGDYAAAHAAFARALALAPDDLQAAWAAMQYPPEAIHADDASVAAFRAGWDTDFARLAARLDATPPALALATVTSASNFFRHYVDEDVLDVQRSYAALLERIVARAVPFASLPARPAGDDRIRVALFSAHFYDHTILRLFGPMLGALDRQRFDVHAFSAGLHDHAGRAFAARVENHTHGALSVGAWAERIRAFAPDVLIYADIGMDAVSQCLSTLRLAPVQAVLWGHPVTTGSSAIDWFLTPGRMEPANAESHYSERLWRLPGVGCCFEPPETTPETPPELAERDSARVEVGFVQSFAKNLPHHDRLLARIAQRAPSVRFHLTPANNPRISDQVRARTEAAFAAAGLDPARHLGIIRGLPRPQFLALGGALDFAVDSLGWSGGNTTLEMLWGGLPVITCPGRTMRTRHTLAMLELLELPELIAGSEDELAVIAARLAGSADLRADLRGRIEARKHRLFEDRSVIGALEDFILQTCRPQLAAGLDPGGPRQ